MNQLQLEEKQSKTYNVHMYHVDPKTGEKTDGYNHGVKMNATPMTHQEACTFKSKMMHSNRISYQLVEVHSENDINDCCDQERLKKQPVLYKVIEEMDGEDAPLEKDLTLDQAERRLCWHCNLGGDAYLQEQGECFIVNC